jgi:hypothetical protein
MRIVVCVCGGRVGVSDVQVFKVLNHIAKSEGWTPDLIEVIEGGAPCVDRFAGRWARKNAYAHATFRVNKDIDGADDQAPKRRNRRMKEQGRPQVCIGFPGGPGTRDMMDICHRAGVRVLDVELAPDLPDGFEVHEWRPYAQRHRA